MLIFLAVKYVPELIDAGHEKVSLYVTEPLSEAEWKKSLKLDDSRWKPAVREIAKLGFVEFRRDCYSSLLCIAIVHPFTYQLKSLGNAFPLNQLLPL